MGRQQVERQLEQEHADRQQAEQEREEAFASRQEAEERLRAKPGTQKERRPTTPAVGAKAGTKSDQTSATAPPSDGETPDDVSRAVGTAESAVLAAPTTDAVMVKLPCRRGRPPKNRQPASDFVEWWKPVGGIGFGDQPVIAGRRIGLTLAQKGARGR